MTDTQLAVGKPWAILAIVSKVVNLLILIGAIIYLQTVPAADNRLFWIVCITSILIERGIWRYYAYRTAKIMGTPDSDARALLWPRFEVLLIVLAVILTVAQYR